ELDSGRAASAHFVSSSASGLPFWRVSLAARLLRVRSALGYQPAKLVARRRCFGCTGILLCPCLYNIPLAGCKARAWIGHGSGAPRATGFVVERIARQEVLARPLLTLFVRLVSFLSHSASPIDPKVDCAFACTADGLLLDARKMHSNSPSSPAVP